MNRRICLFLFALATAVPAVADAPKDLTALFPQDTLIFAERSGASAAGKAAEETSFGRMLAEPEFKRLIDGVLSVADQAIQKGMAEEKIPAELYQAAQRVARTLWDRPAAIGLIDLQLDNGRGIVDAALVCHAGEAAPQLAGDILMLLKATGAPQRSAQFAGRQFTELNTGEPDSPLYFGVVDEYFVALLGERSQEVLRLIEAGGDSLRENESIVAARKRMLGNDSTRSICAFLNASKIKTRFRGFGTKIDGVDQQKADQIFGIIDDLGFENLSGVCWESHFTNDGCYTASFLHTPGGGKGLFSTQGKPLAESDLQCIPKDATWAAAVNLDVADAVRELLERGKSIDPQIAGGLQMAEGVASNMLGMPIIDFLELFEDTFVMFDAPDNGGFWMSGTVLMIKSTEDPIMALTHLKMLIENIARTVKDDVRIEVIYTRHGDYPIGYINVVGQPVPIAPAFGECNGWIIMGLYPQIVTSTIDRLSEGDLKKSSILSNPDFIRSRKVLGRLGTSMTYVDTRASVRVLYPFVLGLAQAGAAMAQGEGIEIDVTCIPSLRTIQKHMHSQVQFTQTFDDGTLSASYGAFPIGVNTIASTGLMASPLVIGIAAPAMVAAREAGMEAAEFAQLDAAPKPEPAGDANAVCTRNLLGIGQGMLIYANSHGGRFPTSFQACIDDALNTPHQFVCPRMADRPMADLEGCYVLVPGQSTYDDPRNVLVYERTENHRDEGIVHVVFVDAHVEAITPAQLTQKLKETAKRRGLPEN